MTAAPARIPTKTELDAHQRRAAFRRSIEEGAAALQKSGMEPQTSAPIEALDLAQLLPPMKEPWFSIENVTVIKKLKIRDIQAAVCDHYGLTLAELLKERRFRPLVRARQAAMYLCKELTGSSLPAIGRRFGGKDHTTVLHASRMISAIIDPESRRFDAAIAAAVTALRAELEARH
jgi:chromosomal replication initiation ATPase DnaA